jgi:hypothetical protein
MRRALTVVVSLLVGLTITEGVARVLYREPWYDRLLGEQLPQVGFVRRFAIRDELPTERKKPGERRIMFLGDSFTFGSGVADDQAVFPRRIEKSLNERAPLTGVSQYSAFNAAVPGSLTARWLALWKRLHRDVDPDVVVIVFFLRDGTLTGMVPGFFGKVRTEIVERNRASKLYRYSYLYRTLRDRFDRRLVGQRYTDEFTRSYFGHPDETSEWQRAKANLLAIRDSAQHEGVTVGFVVFPMLVELNDSYPFRDICDLVESFGRTAPMETMSLLGAFFGQDGPSLWVGAYNQHPNERAHAIAAEALLPFITRLLEMHERARSR